MVDYIIKNKIESQKWLDTLEGLDSIKKDNVIDSMEIFAWMRSWGSENELKVPKINS